MHSAECERILLKEGKHAVQGLDADIIAIAYAAKGPAAEVEGGSQELVFVRLRLGIALGVARRDRINLLITRCNCAHNKKPEN